ncbi:DNA alkylation repair protein [Akkermansiaceae bacterium]|nr:DNA alkylation repair protein [Akkermansiaceae bacterium]MDB4537767.1 DNA alkylation repair protein [Akkermansiaceae bacterium]
MDTSKIMAELKKLGNEQTKKTLMRHGAVEPFFGVKIGDTKPLQKKYKGNHAQALELYATGNSDAMYLAGLIADEKAVTKAELNRWVNEAPWALIANSTVAALAAESPHAMAVASKWVDSKKELIASAGWTTLAHYVSVTDDTEIDGSVLEDYLKRATSEIHDQVDLVKAAMNAYLISLGSYYGKLTKKVKAAAKKIGKVEVDHGNTACKTPDIIATIEKIEGMGRIGRKRKAARC